MMKWILPLVAVLQCGACERPGHQTSAQGAIESNQMHILDPIDSSLAADQIDPLRRRALSGDNEAASALASHFFQAGRVRDELQWLRIAAERGHCPSIVLLRDHPSQAADRAATQRWNSALRENECTWRKTYVADLGDTPDFPLWTEE